jgi:glyoxylase-like metal-dependent hydrolase (beta-lactamase superfamily II)
MAPRIANAWLLRDAEGRSFLIDSGHRVERAALAGSLRRAGITKGKLTALLLTHRHCDHAGNAAWVRDVFRCPVICHAHEASVLSGDDRAEPLGGRGAGWIEDVLCRVEDRFPARTPVDDVFQSGSFRWGFQVIAAAGHTAGSSLLLHEPTGSLFTGDALLSGMPTQRWLTRLTLAIPAFSEDVGACHRAVLDFLRQRPAIRTLCTGHGPAVRHGLKERLDELVRAPSFVRP